MPVAAGRKRESKKERDVRLRACVNCVVKHCRNVIVTNLHLQDRNIENKGRSIRIHPRREKKTVKGDT